MSATAKPPRRWRRGEVITAARLNEAVDAINRQPGPSRGAAVGREAGATTDSPDGTVQADVWAFVSSETRTVRLEDSEDSDVYIDVEVTRSVTLKTPAGTYVKLQLEDPSNG